MHDSIYTSEVSLAVPDFIISGYISLCNFSALFLLLFFLINGIAKAVYGMLEEILIEKEKKRNGDQKTDNHTMCRTQKWLTPGLK